MNSYTIQLTQLYMMISSVKAIVKKYTYMLLYSIFSIIPLSNKIVGSSFAGTKYENNPRFVFEKLEEKYPNIKKIWIKKQDAIFELPPYVHGVSGKLRTIYEYATAKVIIDSHFIPFYYTRRKGQLSIFMYHGGIGIKRNSNEVPSKKVKSAQPKHNADNMSFFVSNSNFTSHVIRTSLEFSGPILKCGYPKDDPLFDEQRDHKMRVCRFYGISSDLKILMYAPTYRQNIKDISGYNINLVKACESLSHRFGGKWIAIVKWHPKQKITSAQTRDMYGEGIIDATDYSNMQELIIASDAFISDYSSCVFEAAERKIPCFSFATDWETFKFDQGVHFEIDQLPFPYCKNNEELVNKIKDFDEEKYQRDLAIFMQNEGLCDTGKASEELADIIHSFISGNHSIMNELKFEEE